MEWIDRSVLAAASWRIASELARRHPDTTRLTRAHLGGGQYDCLRRLPTAIDRGNVQLNRRGTIQVLERFDGRPATTSRWSGTSTCVPTPATSFIVSRPRRAYSSPSRSLGATHATLTYGVLATIPSTAVKSVHPIEIQLGFIDSSGYDAGPNEALTAFAAIPAELLFPREDDMFGKAGYRFWVVLRDDVPVLAFEQREGLAWTPHHDVGFSLMGLYEETRRHLLVTTLKLLRKVDQV